jgi:phosphoribosylamine--glycine ligase
MARHNVPTRGITSVIRRHPLLTWTEGDPFGYPLVLKADGLAAGKGVVIVETVPRPRLRFRR